jgi:CDP-diacylglycerol---glycerol-3-phosphate 3-phosphatidyltransferase
MEASFNRVKLLFEKIDTFRDNVLFVFIKPYWPRKITPNQLTIFRIIIGLLLFILLFYYKNTSEALIITLFCIGALTDMLDGSVARGLNMVTRVGEMLDPAADRILIIPIAIYSLSSDHKWLLLSLLLLEILNGLASIWWHGKDKSAKSNIFGKVKMFLQCIVFADILIFWPKPPHTFFVYMLWLSVAFLLASIFLKYWESKHETRN